MDEEGRATLFKFGFVHLKSTISLSQSIFIIMHIQRTQFFSLVKVKSRELLEDESGLGVQPAQESPEVGRSFYGE